MIFTVTEVDLREEYYHASMEDKSVSGMCKPAVRLSFTTGVAPEIGDRLVVTISAAVEDVAAAT